MTAATGLPAREIRDLWIAPDGRLWLVATTGIFVRSGGEWLTIYAGAANRVLGSDDAGRIWAVVVDGWRIAAYADGAWTLYGPGQGWRQGYGRHLVTDRLGRVWVAVQEELRRFDPQAQVWDTLTANAIGFEPLGRPVEPGRFLTDLALDRAGNIWVGNCIYDGILIEGQGVRWFDGQAWYGSAETAGECIEDIEVDQVGRVWMSAFDGLIQYDPATASWSRFPLPPWERRQIVTSITLDGQGDPWITFTRFGPTGPWHSSGVYHLRSGLWAVDYDPNVDVGMVLVPAPGDVFWLCAEGTIYRLAGGAREEVGSLPGICRQMAMDGYGRLWIAGEAGVAPALWWFEPEE